MILDFTFGLTFIGTLALIFGRIKPKFRELGAIPHETVIARLHENPSKIRIFLLHFRTLYHKRYHHLIVLDFFGKTTHRAHIRLMRLDNAVVRILKGIRAKYEMLGGENGTSWRDMIEIPAAALRPDMTPDVTINDTEDANTPEPEHMFLRKYRAR